MDRSLDSRIEHLEIALYGDPAIKDDSGLRGDMRELREDVRTLLALQQGGKLALRALVFFAAIAASISAGVQFINSHFNIGLK